MLFGVPDEIPDVTRSSIRAQMTNASSCIITNISEPVMYGMICSKLKARIFTKHSSSHGVYLPLHTSQHVYHRFESCFCILGSFLQSGFFCLRISSLLVETLL